VEPLPKKVVRKVGRPKKVILETEGALETEESNVEKTKPNKIAKSTAGPSKARLPTPALTEDGENKLKSPMTRSRSAAGKAGKMATVEDVEESS